MKKSILITLLSICQLGVIAQPIPSKDIEDKSLGWMKVYHFKGAKEPLKIDDKVYTVAQLSICDTLLNWMQASYVPKGGLGDAKKSVSEKITEYNKNTASLPQSYGAYTKTYTELKYNSTHKIEPLSNSHELWSIMANGMTGYPVNVICTPAQYYFTLPSFAEQGYDDETPKPYGLTTHPNTKKYFTYFRRNSRIGNEKIVILCKDNRLPFIQITRAEYIEQLAAAIERKYAEDKEKAIKGWPEGKARAEALKYADDQYQVKMSRFNRSKEKYQNRLQEKATVSSLDPDATYFSEGYDIFDGTGGSSLRLPVYKIDPAVAVLCKKDRPQWITITWTGELNSPVGKYHHESTINNFNFDYVYSFFFDPEKVKGQSYEPLRSPLYKEAVVTAAASESATRNAEDKTIHFFEDFSTTSVGKTPIGWKTNLAQDGSSSVVTKPDGLEGNWAIMARGYTIVPNQVKKPLPQNFTLSYDMIAAQNFTWGAKGLIFKIAQETSPGNAQSFLQLKIRPGSNGNDGEVAVETKFPSPYLNTSKWLVAKGFSNDKKLNRINVTIEKKGETLQLFIDKIKIAEYEKALPSSLLFNAMSFYAGGGDSENDKFYVSNIKITKE